MSIALGRKILGVLIAAAFLLISLTLAAPTCAYTPCNNTAPGRSGRAVPQLYSKLAASQELRKMLNIGGHKDRPETDVSRLSDAELMQLLADQAKELGIEIDLNYRFAEKSDE
jgi:hypothetical protein